MNKPAPKKLTVKKYLAYAMIPLVIGGIGLFVHDAYGSYKYKQFQREAKFLNERYNQSNNK